MLKFVPEKETQELPSPQHLMIIGAPKTGKSTIMALLPNSGILNIEPGGIDGYRFLKHVAVTNDLKSLDEFKKLVGEAITWSKANDNKKPYEYFIIDNMDVFEDWSEEQATTDYMESETGKGFNRWTAVELQKENLTGKIQVGAEKTGKHRKSVITLPRGAGYYWLRNAFKRLLNTLPYFADKIIYVCHVKDKTLEKDGQETTVRSVNLTGQAGPILAGMCDACCFLKRDNDKVVADFSIDDAISGCRIPALEGKKIVISEKDKEGNITVFWNKIFPEIKENKSVNFG